MRLIGVAGGGLSIAGSTPEAGKHLVALRGGVLELVAPPDQPGVLDGVLLGRLDRAVDLDEQHLQPLQLLVGGSLLAELADEPGERPAGELAGHGGRDGVNYCLFCCHR